MSIERVPLVTSVEPDFFSNGRTEAGPSTKNVLYSKYADGRLYATQRPAIKVTSDPEDAGESRVLGRGIFYWDEVADYYFVRGDEVYKSDYSNFIGNISGAGRNKVYFATVGTKLVIIDPEENNGYYIDSSLPTTIVSIASGNFPGNIAGEQLVGGAVSVDGFLFLMTASGLIYNSALNAPQTWNLDFIGADIDSDNGIALHKHHNHVCAIGTDSIEFFYNAGNPSGSPLQRRQDIFHLEGAIDYNSVCQSGDLIYYLGRSTTGTIGLHVLEGFKTNRVSTDTIDRFIGDTYTGLSDTNVPMRFWLSSASFGEHMLVFMTSVQDNSTGIANWFPIQTTVFDSSTGLWSIFESILTTISPNSATPNFSIADVASPESVASNKGSMILLTGNICSVDLSGVASDYTGNTDEYIAKGAGDGAYSDDPYFIDGYIVSAPDNPADNNIELSITMPELDFDLLPNKNCHRMSIVGNTLQPASNLTSIDVSWSDNRYKVFSTARQLDTGFRRSLTRLGNFKRRAFRLDYTGADLLRIESLELDLRASRYA